jgi:peroxiredoxin
MRDWRGSIMICFIVVSFMTCSSSSSERANDSEGPYVTIRGKVAFPQQGQIVVQELKDGATGWSDTIKLKSDNSFVKKVKVSEPGYYRINFYNMQVINLILYKSDLVVNVEGNSMTGNTEILGSPEIEFVRKAQAMEQVMQKSPEGVKLNEEFNAAVQRSDQAKIAETQRAFQLLVGGKVAALIREQPASLGVINFLQSGGLDKDDYFDVYIEVADKLKKEWPNFAHAKEFVNMVESIKKTAVGMIAPEIALPDPQGQVVKLSSLRGKYVLVDFWAKWCGPCRDENPNVVRVFNKYKNKGFTVFGVSLDRNKADWTKAIQEDGLTWTHVSDLKYWQSEAARLYNVSAIPFSLLLDPDGKIIAKNLRGVALDQKLEEVFSK